MIPNDNVLSQNQPIRIAEISQVLASGYTDNDLCSARSQFREFL
jgi:hypothetical protein